MDASSVATFFVVMFLLQFSKEPYCKAGGRRSEVSSKKPNICTVPSTTTPPPVCSPSQDPFPSVKPKSRPKITANEQETTIKSNSTVTFTTTRAYALESTDVPFERFGQGADRIVGGSLVDITEVPYQASLQKKGSHICGACIISNFYLITAAHCNSANASVMRVRVGSSLRTSGGQLLAVAKMISHPQYVTGRADYDFCIIRLKSQLVFTPKIQPIQIIERFEEISPDSYLMIQGWGLIYETGPVSLRLLQIMVPVISTEYCMYVYGNKAITKRMFCAGDLNGDTDSCQGDSGGPAVCEGVLVGIVSWGNGCARPGYPGVYAKIANQRDWITNMTGV